jgi:hypothetical protein
MTMAEKGENPLKLPKRKISEEEANYYARSGGSGGKSLEVPTFMREEQEKIKNLPKAKAPQEEGVSKN